MPSTQPSVIPDVAPTQLVVVVGPTASGKTGLAIALARSLGGEIVSADAFAIYRHMDLGTAKPTTQECEAARHHVVSVLEPSERCNAQRWLDLAQAAIADIRSRGRIPIIAGGTPLYVKALLEGLSAGAPRDEALRERLHHRYQAEGGEALLAELARLDPVYAADRHANDERRIVRALEVIGTTGQPYSSFHTTDGVRRSDLSPLLLGLSWPRDELHRRINRRVKEMFAAGLTDEVARIRAHASPEAMQAVGYKEVLGYLDRQYGLERAIELVKRNTRQLARHQHTWYRRWRDIVWLAADDPGLTGTAESIVRGFLATGTITVPPHAAIADP